MTDRPNLDASTAWLALSYDIYRATAALMLLLEGMEAARQRRAEFLQSVPLARRAQAAAPTLYPMLSYIDIPISLHGAGFEPDEVLGLEGEAEQLAYRGWVERIYRIWESSHRADITRAIPGSDIIPPEIEALGDLRRIRNDLVHNRAVASREHSGKCRVLVWFASGVEMKLQMRHVLDFFNQLGLTPSMVGSRASALSAGWLRRVNQLESLTTKPTPEIVSLRVVFDHLDETDASWYVVSLVFANAVFAYVPVVVRSAMGTLAKRINWIERIRINEHGDLLVANGELMKRDQLYRDALLALAGNGPRLPALGLPGPAIRLRKDPGPPSA